MNLYYKIGGKIQEIGGAISNLGKSLKEKSDPYSCFKEPDALKINEERLKHLASLKLSLHNKSVLEVGAGIGLHTIFFEKLNCDILSTDARQENIDYIQSHYKNRKVKLLQVAKLDDYNDIGQFDIVYCYGLLYHTDEPRKVLESLSKVCRGQLLLETCVTPGDHIGVHLCRESNSYDQAVGLVGCRPTRRWIMDTLRELWGYAYVSKMQPNHYQFPTDWEIPTKSRNYRAVFVGSKNELENQLLCKDLPTIQERI